jgi:hypothetical protein
MRICSCVTGVLAWPCRPLRASGAGKRLECPKCREPCTVKGGDARTLPVVYDFFGA